MRKVLYLAILIPCLCFAAITDVQHPAGVLSSGVSTCAVTIATNGTGATRLLIYKVATANGTTLSSVSGGGTWTVCGANCNAADASAGETSIAYLNAPTTGVTTVTGTVSLAGNNVCWVEEYSTTTSGFTLETISATNKKVDTTCTTACASATPTISGTSDVISAISSCGGTCSGTITGWSTLYTSGDGSARQVNTTTTAFNWNQTSGTLSTATIAFKENSAGVTCAQSITLMGVGCR